MTASHPMLAAVRFGYGQRPDTAAPRDGLALLAGLAQPDPFEQTEGVAPLARRTETLQAATAARRAKRKGADTGEELKRLNAVAQQMQEQDYRAMFLRAVVSPYGFRERLVSFWADHFAIGSGNARLRLLRMHMRHEAIRPHVAGSFADLLKAAVTHPAMLVFLNQTQSLGPNSRMGRKRKLGLNENLAREVIELHTLGVEARYTQRDVREFAELLTGLSVDGDGFRFRRAMVEPGAEEVLGKSYQGPGTDNLPEIMRALDDLAMKPETARHLARKLIVHFIGIEPPKDWVASMSEAYLAEGGSLIALYRHLIDDDRAWDLPLRKAKTPFDFIVSSLRALGLTEGQMRDLNRRELRGGLVRPMAEMGQNIDGARGPDGWSEDPEAWITPAGLAARIRWAGGASRRLARETDPRAFLDRTLGPLAGETLRFAVAGAETRADGVALVLASPEFNRR